MGQVLFLKAEPDRCLFLSTVIMNKRNLKLVLAAFFWVLFLLVHSLLFAWAENPTEKTTRKSGELLAEEIAARTAIHANCRYSWNIDNKEAKISMVSGITLDFIPHETEHSISVNFSWTNDTAREHKEIRKYLGPKCDQVISVLRKMNWATSDKTLTMDSAEFVASMPIHQFRNKLDRLSKTLADVINLLTFN